MKLKKHIWELNKGRTGLEIEITENDLTAEEFTKIRSSVGLSILKDEQIERAIAKSLYVVCARNNGKPVGMGRLVGDGAYVYYLQNINVIPSYQGNNIGAAMIDKLIDYIKKDKLPDTSVMVLLMSSRGCEKFYKKFGFRSRPNDNEGSGMIMNLN